MVRPMKSKVLAECIGTFALVFAGCGAIMISERFELAIPLFSIPFVFGGIVATMIYSVGHISGAHFNPAVTLAFAISRHFPQREILPYWLAQFSGGLIAVTLLYYLLPEGTTYGATVTPLAWHKALAWEVILSFLLMFVIVAVATDTRAVGIMAGAAIGTAIVVLAILGGPVTGASMNPARTLAPNLFQHEFSNLWIYFIGPCIGASLAALTYQKIRCEKKTKNTNGCC